MTGRAIVRSGTAHTLLAPGLLDHRLAAALSQEDLALRARVSRATVARAEQGKPIRLSSVRKLARALKVPPAALTSQVSH